MSSQENQKPEINEEQKPEEENVPVPEEENEDAEKLLKQQRELAKKIQELQKEYDFLGKKTKRFEERKEAFKQPRSEFCFRIKDANEDDSGRYIQYLKKMVAGMGKRELKTVEAKEFKVLKDIFYFKTSEPITIGTINFEAKDKGNFKGFKLEQLRPSNIFDDYSF